MIQDFIAVAVAYFALTVHVATVTAYCPQTTDSRWNHIARWAGEPPIVGVSAACPEAWKMEWIYIQDYGWRRCEDTPRYGWYTDEQGNVTSHIDVYLGSREEALRHGIQQLTVWKARD